MWFFNFQELYGIIRVTPELLSYKDISPVSTLFMVYSRLGGGQWLGVGAIYVAFKEYQMPGCHYLRSCLISEIISVSYWSGASLNHSFEFIYHFSH